MFNYANTNAYADRRDFKNNWALGAVGTHYAYAYLKEYLGDEAKPGEGVTIGFIDSGIDTSHEAFGRRTVTEQFMLGATDETGSRFSHGTAVASVAAGNRSNLWNASHGVAWAADVAMFAIPFSSRVYFYLPVSLRSLASEDSEFAGVFNTVLGWSSGNRTIDILNLSIGYNGGIEHYSEQDLRDNYGSTIAALAQASASDKVILVWAGGNAHGRRCVPTVDPNSYCVTGSVNASSVELLAGLVVRIAELQGHSIAVVSLGRNGQIAGSSNRCGIAADWCIAAPGEDIRVAYFGTPTFSNVPIRTYGNVGGTSYAAPLVAGGLAILKQVFRNQLSNTELVTRLFATANKNGWYGNKAIYGQGRMDLSAAAHPVGVLDVPIVTQGLSNGMPLVSTMVRLGEAFGDGLERSFDNREFVAFDDLGAPFWFRLGHFASVEAGSSMTQRLREFLGKAPKAEFTRTRGIGLATVGHHEARRADVSWWQLGILETPTRAEFGHLALADRAMSLTVGDHGPLSGTAFTTEGVWNQRPSSGVAFSWQPDNSPLGLDLGWMGERESLLGSTAQGAFGELAADAAFVGIEASSDHGGWQVRGSAQVGTVSPRTDNGLITSVSPLTTSTYSLQASKRFVDNSALRLSVSQPLRVEHGSAILNVPVGRTKEREVIRSSFSTSLTPSGRQIDIAARWLRPLSVGALRLGVVATHDPGHRRAADTEVTLISGWQLAF